MAGLVRLVPAIHDFLTSANRRKTWMPATSAGMTWRVSGSLPRLVSEQASLRLDACELDHLGPLRHLGGHELLEIGRRARDDRPAELGKARLDPRIGEPRVDLPVDQLHDLGRRVARRADAV